MPKTFRPYDPDQMLLMPPAVQDWVPAGDLAHFIGDLVEELDLCRILEVYERGDLRGYPPYHPRMMTKLCCTPTRPGREVHASWRSLPSGMLAA